MAIVETSLITWACRILRVRASALSLLAFWLVICLPTNSTFAQSAEKLEQAEIVKKEYPFPVQTKEQKLMNEAYAAFNLYLPTADSLKRELDQLDVELSPADSAAYHYALGIHHYYAFEYDQAMELYLQQKNGH